MLTLESLIVEMGRYHNDICILYDMDLVRLVGVGEDKDDFYYIVRSLSKGEFWASAVGSIISLKGLYPEDRYSYMDYLFTINGVGRTKKFLVEIKD